MLTSKLIVAHEDTLAIYYRDRVFLEFVRESLRLLRAYDPLHYLSVKRRVRSIVEFREKASFIGHVTGTFVDYFSLEQREKMGAKRYAGRLVGFATHLRLLDDWGIESAIRFRSHAYLRIAQIAARRELDCCIALDCDATDIRYIRGWLKHALGKRKRSS